MDDWFKYNIIGETLDDAVGECFDKVARMLDLPYPGGPEISKLADEARKSERKLGGAPQRDGARTAQFSSKKIAYPQNFAFALPRPMLTSKNCDMSFSGLKTAALYALRDFKKSRTVLDLSNEEKAGFAKEFEDAVGDVFVAKTRRALEDSGAQTFVIGGGVAANRYLRERLQALILEEFPDVELRLPELSITGDNAIMIAQAALTHLLMRDWELKSSSTEIRAVGNLSIANP
jgi:N6-L-threonylcarbamoyladenine synthase